MSTLTTELPEPSNNPAAWSTPQRKVLAGLLAVVFLFHITTLRPGHDWGGDFAQYLSHARNLATLRPYADTGYVYNPAAPEIGPQAYPPIFPLLLAPLVVVYGADFVVLKVTLLILFVGSLMIAASLFAHRLSAWGTVAAIAVLAFCPVFWELNHQVLSEHLFTFWWLLAMWLYQRSREGDEPMQTTPGDGAASGALLGVVVYLAMGTRTVGIILPAAVLVTEVLRFRRITGYAATAVATSVVLYVVQAITVPSGGAGYLAQLSQVSPRTIAWNLYADAVSFSYVWRNGHWEWLREGAGVLFALVAVWGFLCASRSGASLRPRLLAVASLFYFVLIVVWPTAAWTRMIWPLLPGFVFWIVYAMENGSPASRWAKPLLTGFVVFTLASYAAWYAQADYTRIPGPEDVEAQELFAQVRHRSTADDVTLFFKPRVLAFFAQSRSVGFPTSDGAGSLAETLERHDVTQAALRREETGEELRTLLQSRRFTRVWQNDAFELWQQTPETAQAAPEPSETPD